MVFAYKFKFYVAHRTQGSMRIFLLHSVKVLSAGPDKNHAGDSTWWVTDLADFHLSERF